MLLDRNLTLSNFFESKFDAGQLFLIENWFSFNSACIKQVAFILKSDSVHFLRWLLYFQLINCQLPKFLIKKFQYRQDFSWLKLKYSRLPI
jgi:hypothetical protein